MSIHPAAEGYSHNADSYARGRPSYPPQLFEWLVQVTGLAAGDHVVDLGAGTGKFTAALVELGAVVTAVEPVAAMREELARVLPGVTTVDAVAQHLPFAASTVDLVACGQSFHWFADDEAVAEIARVLRPGGHLVLAWNQRDLSSPVQQKLAELLVRFDAATAPHSPLRRWRPALDRCAALVPAAEANFAHVHVLDRAEVADRFRSMSVYPSLTEPQQTDALGELAAVIGDRARVELPYETETYVFRRTG